MDCSTYRSEITNEDISLMDGQSNLSQSDGIDGFGTLVEGNTKIFSTRHASVSGRGSERLEVGHCSIYRSEITNEGMPLMDGQSKRSQSDGIDGFGTLASVW